MQTITQPPRPPRSFLPGGQLVAFRRDPLKLLTHLARTYGDITGFRIGPQAVYLVNDPEAIRRILVTDADNFIKGRALQRAKRLLGEGLLTSENPIHRRQRRLAQPAFHRQRITTYADKMVECALQTSAAWKSGESVDIAQEMNRLALAIVSRTLFDTNTEETADEIEESLTSMLALFQYLLLPYTEILERLPLPQVRRFNRARAKLDRVIYRIIAEHRASLRAGVDRGDLLSMFLQAQDEESHAATDDAATSRGMSDEQVRDEAMTIFLAGHETTANALAWTWYYLANTRGSRKSSPRRTRRSS
jgi:cytochrome P450